MTFRTTRMMATMTLVFAVSGAPAGKAMADRILTWEDCVRLALEANPELKASQATLSAATEQVKGTYGLFLPQLSANLGYAYGKSDFDGSSATLDSVRSGNAGESYNANLSLSQNLFNGWGDKARLDQAKATRSSASSGVVIARAKSSFDLKSAFTNMSFALNSTELAKEIIARRQRNLELVQLRFESGRENKGSVLLSQAYLSQAKYEQVQAANDVVTARADLAKALGLDTQEEIAIKGDVPMTMPPEKVRFEELAKQTPQHEQVVAQEENSEAGIRVAKSKLLPSLNLTGSVGRVDDTFFPENGNRWTAGVTLSIPLFAGGQNYHGLQAARANAYTSTYNRQATDLQLISTLKKNYSTFVEAVEKAKVDHDFMLAARTRAEIARKKYDNGLLSFEEWDIIENDLVSREKAALQSQRDRVIAEATWEQSLGRGVLQ